MQLEQRQKIKFGEKTYSGKKIEGVLWFLSPGNDEEKAGRGEGGIVLMCGLVGVYLPSVPPQSSFPPPPSLKREKD